MVDENQPALSPMVTTATLAGEPAAIAEAPAVSEVAEPEISAADEVAAKGIRSQVFERLRKEPKERIRIAKAMGPQTVIINGARYDVPANVPVDVPKTVADILRSSDRI